MPHDGSVPRVLEFSFDELQPTLASHTDPLTTPVSECFHWDDLLKQQQRPQQSKFYVVVFRSVRSTTANDEQLYAADEAAQLEAKTSGGLLKYWYGTLNDRRECLAMCVWDSRDSAKRAMGKPAHFDAMKLAAKMYDFYTLERYWLDISQAAGCSLELIGKTSS